MTQPAQSSGHEWVSIGEGMYGYCQRYQLYQTGDDSPNVASTSLRSPLEFPAQSSGTRGERSDVGLPHWASHHLFDIVGIA